MEIKINKELKEYTETMFFGLSVRQFIFALLACGEAVGIYFGCRSFLGTETLSCFAWWEPRPCGSRLYPITDDSRAVGTGMVPLRGADAAQTVVSGNKYACKSRKRGNK